MTTEEQLLAALKELNDVKAALAEHSIVPITGASGKITYAKSNATIEERVTRRIAELERSNHSLRIILDSSPNAFVMADRAGRMVMVNTMAERLFGYGREEMVGQAVEILVPERFRGHHPGHRAGFHAAPRARPMGAGRDLFGRRKDGSEFPIEIGLNPLETEEGPMILSAIVDITERKRAEAALRESDERLHLAKSAAGIGIWDYDITSGTLRWDDRMRELWGLPPDLKITYDDFMSGLHPDDRAATQAAVDRGLDPTGDGHFHAEYRVIGRLDGVMRWVSATGRGFFEQGRAARMVGTAQDITERKRAEEQLTAKNAELKRFAYSVSHDLKAPLRGISGYAQELDRRHRAGLGERALFCINQIVTATKNLDRLIEDLLSYSRLDTETPALSDVNVPALVQTLLKDRSHTIAERSIEMTVEIPFTTMRCWERGLSQVLANLVDNAIKYTRDAKPPRVRITGEDLPQAWRLTVADNGIGFDMKYHDRIFGLFNRLVRAEEFEGTGAGLAIVQRLVEKQNGRVWAQSAPGQGATFFVELPKR